MRDNTYLFISQFSRDKTWFGENQNKERTLKVLIDMTKRRKNVKPKKPSPEQDHFLMRIKPDKSVVPSVNPDLSGNEE